MEKNKNNNTPSSLTPTIVPTLTAPGLWDSIQGQHGRLSGDAAFVARLRAEKALSDPDPGPAILEFLRFAYLAWTTPEGATPSVSVDEIWHTLILFTRSYERFCFETKGTILHHEPGGGEADEKRFRDAYLRTLDRYEAEFGPPPVRYWPRPAVPKPEPPRAIPKPVPKSPARPAAPSCLSPLAYLLFPPATAAVAQLATGDYRAALWGAAVGAIIGIPAAIAASAGAAGAQAPKPPPKPTKARAATSSTTTSSSGGGDGGVSFLGAADASPGHGHGGDGGSSGGDSGGSSCGSSCGGGGCGG